MDRGPDALKLGVRRRRLRAPGGGVVAWCHSRVPSVRVGEVDLHYEIHGDLRAGRPPDGPAMVLLHELGSSGLDWPLQLPAFTRCARVITVDLRGHGQSSGAGWPTIERMADDLASLLRALAESAAHVVGLSLGGCVGLALAIRSPGQVRSLTLVNAFARRSPAGMRGVARMLARLGLLAVAPMGVVGAHVARDLFPRPGQAELVRRTTDSLGRNRKGSYFAVLCALVRFDATRKLSSVRCPTLVVAGALDGTVPLSAKRRLEREIPGARLLVVPDSGHATNIDQPDAFNRAVLDFVAAH